MYVRETQKSRARTCAYVRETRRCPSALLCVQLAFVSGAFRFNIQKSGLTDPGMRPRDLEKTSSKETWRPSKGTYKERHLSASLCVQLAFVSFASRLSIQKMDFEISK